MGDGSRRTPVTVVRAVAFHGREHTVTRPFRATCDDGCCYVVKARQVGRPRLDRSLVNEQVAGRLGAAIDAPVPPVVLVDLARDFLLAHGLADVVPGLAHGSLELDGVREANCAARVLSSNGVAVFDGWEMPEALGSVLRVPANNGRFARLALLCAWIGRPGPPWQSLLYDAQARAYGIDFEYHGRPLPEDVSGWLTLALDARVGLTLADLHTAADQVRQVSVKTLAVAIDTPPEWGARWMADLTERRAWLLSGLSAAIETEAQVA